MGRRFLGRMLVVASTPSGRSERTAQSRATVRAACAQAQSGFHPSRHAVLVRGSTGRTLVRQRDLRAADMRRSRGACRLISPRAAMHSYRYRYRRWQTWRTAHWHRCASCRHPVADVARSAAMAKRCSAAYRYGHLHLSDRRWGLLCRGRAYRTVFHADWPGRSVVARASVGHARTGQRRAVG